MTVAELEHRMGRSELQEWIAVFALEAEERAHPAPVSAAPGGTVAIPAPADVTRTMKAWRAARRKARR